MTYRYTDPDGDPIEVMPAPVGAFIAINTTGNGCYIPLSRVEELVAGIRDTARQAAGSTEQQPVAAEAQGGCGCGTYMRCPNGHCSRHYTCQDCGNCCSCQCGQPVAAEEPETDEQRADRLETERLHATGDHEYCGVTCEAEFPSEILRNGILARAIPGSARMLDELLRRTAAGTTP